MKVSSWVSRLRMSFSRPANAFANDWLISWSWPRPPPLSRIDTDTRVCSVVGYVLADDSGITAPSLRSPCGGSSVDVAVDAHGDQRVPVLHFDLGDVADVDVGDPHPGVLLNDDDVGQLRLDGVRTVTAAFGSGQRQ